MMKGNDRYALQLQAGVGGGSSEPSTRRAWGSGFGVWRLL